MPKSRRGSPGCLREEGADYRRMRSRWKAVNYKCAGSPVYALLRTRFLGGFAVPGSGGATRARGCAIALDFRTGAAPSGRLQCKQRSTSERVDKWHDRQ